MILGRESSMSPIPNGRLNVPHVKPEISPLRNVGIRVPESTEHVPHASAIQPLQTQLESQGAQGRSAVAERPACSLVILFPADDELQMFVCRIAAGQP